MPVPLLFKYILQCKMRKVFINSLQLGELTFVGVLVSVIYHTALPITTESDNNIFRYIAIFEQASGIWVSQPITCENPNSDAGLTNTLHSTHAHRVLGVSASVGYLINRTLQKIAIDRSLVLLRDLFYPKELNRKLHSLFFSVFKKKILYLDSVFKENFK